MFLLSLLLVCASVRAFEDSVTDYAPSVNVECPDNTNTQFVREFTASNQSLNPQEAEYVATRLNTTIVDAWKDWLGSGDQLGYNVSYFQGIFPKIGLALPGGGLRAAQWGASLQQPFVLIVLKNWCQLAWHPPQQPLIQQGTSN
ncbi:hypothetical protein K435DRAFT_804229 [Dendrothele bispora CBS 962.96]|uniref:Uncharacterized protein n=1 Tax=Dendrothele bispora (strain CBS 962.96) TaxID=1314807 RepID=A0A4S8LFH2_DENBC|nr:hypothetical protein K435DRAFT_804229 [Dendrothele bispora CBS 962.96]